MKGCVMLIYTSCEPQCQPFLSKTKNIFINFDFGNFKDKSGIDVSSIATAFTKFLSSTTARILGWCPPCLPSQFSLPVKEAQESSPSLGSLFSGKSFIRNLSPKAGVDRGAILSVYGLRKIASLLDSPRHPLHNPWAVICDTKNM